MRVLQKNRLIAIVRVKKPNIIDTGSKEKSPRCRFLYDHRQRLAVIILCS